MSFALIWLYERLLISKDIVLQTFAPRTRIHFSVCLFKICVMNWWILDTYLAPYKWWLNQNELQKFDQLRVLHTNTHIIHSLGKSNARSDLFLKNCREGVWRRAPLEESTYILYFPQGTKSHFFVDLISHVSQSYFCCYTNQDSSSGLHLSLMTWGTNRRDNALRLL